MTSPTTGPLLKLVEALACHPYRKMVAVGMIVRNQSVDAEIEYLSNVLVFTGYATTGGQAADPERDLRVRAALARFEPVVRQIASRYPANPERPTAPPNFNRWLRAALDKTSSADSLRRQAWRIILELMSKHAYNQWEAISFLVVTARRILTVGVVDPDPVGEFIRELRFAPENQQAGIGILSYFSVILRQKLPDANATVSIRQEDDRVILTITHPDGRLDEIVELYSRYGMVVRGQSAPEDLLNDPSHIMALKQKLEIAQLELRQARELRLLERHYNDRRFADAATELAFFRNQLANELRGHAETRDHLLRLVRPALEKDLSPAMLQLLSSVFESILSRSEESLREQVTELKETSPDLLGKLHGFIFSNSIGGVIGNATYDWLRILWPILLK